MKDIDFNIEKSTMRELTQKEEVEVAGGTSPIFPSSIITTRIRTLITTITGDDDEIFEDDFD